MLYGAVAVAAAVRAFRDPRIPHPTARLPDRLAPLHEKRVETPRIKPTGRAVTTFERVETRWNEATALASPAVDLRSGGAGALRLVAKVLVHEGDRHAALPDGSGDALDRGGPDVTAGEDAGHAGFEEVRVAV